MGFSSHEIYMILRARNEASGVLQRLARQLTNDHKNQMDRYKEQLASFAAQNDGLRVNSSNIMSNARTATMAAREKIDAENKVINKVKDRVSKYDAAAQKELQSLSRAKAERAGYITSLRIESNELMRTNAVARENYKKQIDGIKGLKDANSGLYTQAATVLRKNRDEAIAANDAKRRAIGASIDELRKENLAIDENGRRITKLASTYKTRADNSIKASRDIINGHQDEITSIDRTAKKAVEANNVKIASNQKEMASIRESMDLHQQHLNRLEGLGQIYMMTGTSAVIAGGLMVSAFSNAGAAAREYAQAAALTFTQVDKDAQGHVLVTEQAIIDMGKRVAREWPVEFSQIQPAMYDVFSSMDIKSAEIGNKMMDNIAKAAVAGSVEVATAGKGIIEVINAWGMEMGTTAEATATLNRVNDVAFTLVKEGVGSYGQFSDAIGRSIPSAVKAGASYEDMAGGLAFLTRMGMSTTMASTSMGRAFDLIANPKFAANMKKYGLEVADASGNIKPMTEIVNDLQGKMKGMTEVEAATFLKDVTLGAGGTVQAMRFLNHAVQDEAGLFDQLTASMEAASTSGGAVIDNAYEIMANTPAAKLQELANQFEIIKVTVGDVVNVALMPLVNALTQALDWFNNLSPGMQQAITVAGMVMSGLLVLGGVILLIGGFFLMLKAAAVSAGIGMMGVFGPVALVVAGIAALIAIIILVINYWPQISAAAAPVFDMLKSGWDAVVSAVQGFVDNFLGAFDQFQPYFDALWQTISAAWEAVMRTFDQVRNNPFFTEFFGNISTAAGEMGPKLEGLKNAFMQFGTAVGNIFGIVVSVLGTVFTAIGTFVSIVVSGIGGAVIGAFMGLWAGVQTAFGGIIGILTGVMTFLTGVFTLNWQMMGDGIIQIVQGIGATVLGIFTGLIGAVVGAVVGLVQGVIGWFYNLYDVLVGHSIVPDTVNGIIDWIAGLPGAVLAIIISLVTKFVATVVQWGALVGAGINFLVTNATRFMSQLPGNILQAISSLATSLALQGAAWMKSLLSSITSGWNGINSFFNGVPGKIVSAIGAVGSLLTGIGSSIMAGFLSGLKASWSKVTDFVGGIASWIKNNKGPIEKDRKLLIPAGVAILTGLHGGLTKKFGDIKDMVSDVNNEISNIGNVKTSMYPVDGRYFANAVNANTLPENNTYVNINQEINTQEIDPIKHSADLGYELAARFGWGM